MNLARTLINERGMTLVELMVAIGVTIVVMTLSISIFVGQYKSYINRKGVSELQETTPTIVELLKRDIMEAGWSVKPEMALYIQDGGVGGADRIYINDVGLIDINNINTPSEIEKFFFDTEGCSGGSPFSGGDTSSLTIDGDSTAYFTASTSEVFHFVISDSATNKVAKITAADPNGTTLTVAPGLSGSFVAPAIYYCVDDGSDSACHPSGKTSQWALRRSDHSSGGCLAENVVDLQVAYQYNQAGVPQWYGIAGCSPGVDCAPTLFNPTQIELIRFTIVTRVSHQDKTMKNNLKYCRPAVENRTGAAAGSDDCGYVYRTYTVQVKPRNS